MYGSHLKLETLLIDPGWFIKDYGELFAWHSIMQDYDYIIPYSSNLMQLVTNQGRVFSYSYIIIHVHMVLRIVG